MNMKLFMYIYIGQRDLDEIKILENQLFCHLIIK